MVADRHRHAAYHNKQQLATRDRNRTHKFKFGFCSVRLLSKFCSVRVRLVLQFRFGSVRSVFLSKFFKVQNSGLKISILRTFICKTKIVSNLL